MTVHSTRKVITVIIIAVLLAPLFTCYGHANAQGPTVQLGADIDGKAAGDYSGTSVSLNAAGNIVAIGAPFNSGNGSSAGHVRIYQYQSGAWNQLGDDIDGEAAYYTSGTSVSLNAAGNIIAIGAPREVGLGSELGYVRFYQYQSGAWSQLGADIDGEVAGDQSGTLVSLNAAGDIVAIGAPYNSGNGSEAGHVRTYQYQLGAWSQLGADIDGEAAGDYSGTSVSLNAAGDIVAIGAASNSGNESGAGHVRIYQYQSEAWSQLGTDIDGEAAGDYSGTSVSLNAAGDIVAIGAPGEADPGSKLGYVRIYQYQSEAWSQLGADIDGEAAGDQSGDSVSLNTAGDIVAIGAYGNDRNGSYAGHVRIYQYQSGAWSQLGVDIDGEAAYDTSGDSVSLNAVGDIVAIGANGNDGNGSFAGHVRVFGPPTPEIAVQGNGDTIAAGDTSSNITDGTDFGSLIVGNVPITHTFTVSNSGPADLILSGSPAITLTSGTHFSVSTQPGSTIIISNSTTTFDITFNPSAEGSFTDTVNIANNDGDENPYTFVISGKADDVTNTYIPIIIKDGTP